MRRGPAATILARLAEAALNASVRPGCSFASCCSMRSAANEAGALRVPSYGHTTATTAARAPYVAPVSLANLADDLPAVLRSAPCECPVSVPIRVRARYVREKGKDPTVHATAAQRLARVGGGENPRVNGDETVSIPTSFSDGTGPWLGSELRRREPAVDLDGPGWLSSNPL